MAASYASTVERTLGELADAGAEPSHNRDAGEPRQHPRSSDRGYTSLDVAKFVALSP